jgi:phosphatidylethanolamine/phosphatidyl-N-methylethanolamine N-methyltransferase
VSHSQRRNGRKSPHAVAARIEARLQDEARFLRTWLDKPLVTGAVTPSGKALARRMASYIDPSREGPVVELGPGTGALTEAVIRRGVKPDRLVLVEFDPAFCALLEKRFPEARIIQGDAYALSRTLGEAFAGPAAAVVSGLPLFTRPERVRLALLHSAFEIMAPGAPFIQFTYAPVSPIPLKDADFDAEESERIWLNIPPACVWVYRRGTGPRRRAPHRRKKLDLLAKLIEGTDKVRTHILR